MESLQMESKDMPEEQQIHNKILESLETIWMGRELYCYSKVTSTNVVAKEKMQEGGASGLLVVAQEQTAGRGRRGRNWVSPKGEAVYMTLALKPDFPPEKASMLTLVMAYAVVQAICDVTNLSCLIKWPNDIVINQKKVCGILTEMSVGKVSIESVSIENVVIGVGINVNQQDFPQELAEIATSLALETGDSVERERLIAKTIKYFEDAYEMFYKEQSLAFMQKQYNELLANCNREVVVLEPRGNYEGVAEGIDENGQLLVRKPNGELIKVYAGEVSVRGIYGYV